MNIGGYNHRIEYTTNVFINAGADTAELRNWKEKLISIATQIPDQADTLTPVIQLIVAAIAPAKIYMIKHDAIEGMEDEAFIDLLIVVSGKSNTPFKELEPVLEMAYLKDRRVCCSLHGESNVIEGLRTGHLFYSLHCIPENLVYDDKAAVYPIATPVAMQEMKTRIQQQFALTFKKALDFNKSAIFLYEKARSPIIAFLLHQAVELTYRGILQCLNGYDKKTHEIRALKKHARRCAPQLNSFFPDNTEEEKRLLDILENAYLKARYEDQYIVTENDFSLLFKRVMQLQQAATKIIEEKTA
ncbi:HEPN domain-containing protein [Chitinophaga japonensis]|uniref:HEPN domain-containing protein n=1 Tax=Chitinophaga japonensis TaxID=104662 RepID=A0A562SMP7_CHIJA|nr:HEPN domain-containing protein [Chitinophaga japonensis]TWI82577.1 HEPN domain-containing protein [Chitinophaga japonensis]